MYIGILMDQSFCSQINVVNFLRRLNYVYTDYRVNCLLYIIILQVYNIYFCKLNEHQTIILL